MAKKEESFTVKNTSVGTGTDPTTLRDWVSREYVAPADKSSGKGSPNRFSRTNLYQISIFSNLVEAGVSRKIASDVSKKFKLYNPGEPCRTTYQPGPHILATPNHVTLSGRCRCQRWYSLQ